MGSPLQVPGLGVGRPVPAAYGDVRPAIRRQVSEHAQEGVIVGDKDAGTVGGQAQPVEVPPESMIRCGKTPQQWTLIELLVGVMPKSSARSGSFAIMAFSESCVTTMPSTPTLQNRSWPASFCPEASSNAPPFCQNSPSFSALGTLSPVKSPRMTKTVSSARPSRVPQHGRAD